MLYEITVNNNIQNTSSQISVIPKGFQPGMLALPEGMGNTLGSSSGSRSIYYSLVVLNNVDIVRGARSGQSICRGAEAKTVGDE